MEQLRESLIKGIRTDNIILYQTHKQYYEVLKNDPHSSFNMYSSWPFPFEMVESLDQGSKIILGALFYEKNNKKLLPSVHYLLLRKVGSSYSIFNAANSDSD